MTRSACSPLHALCLAACASAALNFPTNCAEDRSPEAWIEQLRSADYEQRRVACERLLALGAGARVALENAAEEADPELAARIAALLEKTPCGTLKLYCRGEDGTPRPNLEGTIEIDGIHPPHDGKTSDKISIKTDANGAAEIALPCRGRLEISVRFGEDWQSPYRIEPSIVRAGVNVSTVIVEPLCTFKGTVIDEDGKPVAGAQACRLDERNMSPARLDLELRPGPAHGARLPVTGLDRDKSHDTDAHGEWTWKNLHRGIHVFAIHAGDNYSIGVTQAVRGHTGETVQLEPVILKKRRPGKLELELKNLDGTPLITNAVQISLEPQTDAEIWRRYEIALRQQLQMNLNDENRRRRQGFSVQFGKTGRENITPGKYRVRVVGGENENEDLFNVLAEIKPGETTKLVLREPPQWPCVKGRVVDRDGAAFPGVNVCPIPEEALRRIAQEDSPVALQARLLAYSSAERLRWVPSDQDGGYTTRHFPPGRYAALWSAYQFKQGNWEQCCGIFFGIEAKTGETVAAAELKLPFAKPKEKVEPPKFSGKVVVPEGISAHEIKIIFEAPYSQATAETDDQGAFKMALDCDEARDGKPICGTLTVLCDDCKPLQIAGELKQDMELKLEAQERGDAQIRFLDEAGRPVPEANVLVVNHTNVSNGLFRGNPFCSGGASTDARGAISLEGLCVGRRELHFYAPGYYLPNGKAAFDVAANKKTDTTLRVERGVTIKGRVKLGAPASSRQNAGGPPAPQKAGGTPAPQGVTVCLSGDSQAAVQSDGSFSFEGVGPGTYFLYALAPGMIFKNAVKIEVPSDPAQVRAGKWDGFELELAPRHALALDFGAACAGKSVKLFALGHAQDNCDSDPVCDLWGEIDGAGRAEFENLAPGKYMAELSDRFSRVIPPPQLIVLDNEEATIQVGELVRYAETFVAQGRVHQSLFSNVGVTLGPFDAQPCSGNSLRENAAIKVTMPADGAGKVRFEFKTTSGPYAREMRLEVRSANYHALHQGAVKWCQDSESDFPALLASGAVPGWYKPRPAGVYEFHNLPAGEYKLIAEVFPADGDFLDPDAENRHEVELGAFTIKGAETVELGALSLEGLERFKTSARKALSAASNVYLLPRDREAGDKR
ncbi:MAG TPA: carboxypeptidase regulatory-like domain-containing protein [Planctomycetota bacterium]|nr:carboxypeptidase regulatory-like domain-containing protein [Planctomycetota bacterium]